jgi:hypothetical protein
MNSEQAQHIHQALAGAYEADHDTAVGACLQAADDINLLMQAKAYGAADWLVANGMMAVENRLRAAAKLAGVVELSEESEAAQ